MEIRKAQEKDIKRIHDLLTQICEIHFAGRPDLFKQEARKYTDEELMEILSDAQRPVLVAVDEQETVVGYAFCIFQQHSDHPVLKDIKTLYIDDLCVDERQRGQGIGTKLYEAVVALARENHCYNLTLNVWNCNSSAMKFYETCGLEPQKTVMEKILSKG